MSKIEDNFLNEEFFEKLLKIINSDSCENQKEKSLFSKILDFSRECYIHGITVGINAAIEIYENN